MLFGRFRLRICRLEIGIRSILDVKFAKREVIAGVCALIQIGRYKSERSRCGLFISRIVIVVNSAAVGSIEIIVAVLVVYGKDVKRADRVQGCYSEQVVRIAVNACISKVACVELFKAVTVALPRRIRFAEPHFFRHIFSAVCNRKRKVCADAKSVVEAKRNTAVIDLRQLNHISESLVLGKEAKERVEHSAHKVDSDFALQYLNFLKHNFKDVKYITSEDTCAAFFAVNESACRRNSFVCDNCFFVVVDDTAYVKSFKLNLVERLAKSHTASEVFEVDVKRNFSFFVEENGYVYVDVLRRSTVCRVFIVRQQVGVDRHNKVDLRSAEFFDKRKFVIHKLSKVNVSRKSCREVGVVVLTDFLDFFRK